MAATIGIVMNPRSRYLRRHPEAIAAMQARLGPRGMMAESKSLDAVHALANDFKAAGVDVVAVAGGDGTAGITIAAFREVYGDEHMPPFALLRGGTMNTVSNALGLPRGSPLVNLERLLAKTANGTAPTTVSRPTLVADGRIGFLFGTGVFHGFLDAYYSKGKNDPSAVTAARTIAHAAASAVVQGPFVRGIAAPILCTLEVDGDVWPEREYMAVTAGTVAEVGLGFKPFHLADRFRGAFHLLAITGQPASVVRDLALVWLGLGLRQKNGRSVAAKRVVITTPTQSVDYMVDGDLYTCKGPLVVETGPTVKIVV
ncbi:MAG: diacylglycerol kinase family protein [Myxococcota bacterium]